MAHKWPSTEREFLRKFPDLALFTIQDLPPELKTYSGSAWSAKHLQACRVLVEDYNQDLPILNQFAGTATNIIGANESLLASLGQFSRDQLRTFPHRKLRNNPFASFFVSLADVAREGSYERPFRLLRHDTRIPERPNFRSGEGEGFSSSPAGGSSPYTIGSLYSPGQQNEAPDFEEQIDRKKHETVSANMAAQFISVILDLYSNHATEFVSTEFDNAPNTFYLKTSQLNCICQDDGAIWRRKFNPVTRAWLNVERVGAISYQDLGQQFCELLGPVLSQVQDGDFEALEHQNRRRFLISVHQSDVTIAYCEFSMEYLSYIYSEQRPQHLPYITMHRSRKYDLCDSTERRLAAQAIVALAEHLNSSI
ncbi:hypothetical protein ACLOAV_004635 [Pseudogymnoascus australis]